MARARFSQNQSDFINGFVGQTGIPGMDRLVVAAWVAAEQPIGADWPVGHRDNNWLNIGLTDSKWFFVERYFPANDPLEAGRNAAKWMMGRLDIEGFGRSASGIRNIVKSAGKSPEDQIKAIQASGWDSGGHVHLPAIYRQLKEGGTNLSGGIVRDAVDSVGDAVSAPMDALGSFFGTITSASFWVRAGKVVIGLALVIIGILRLTGV